MKIEIEIEDLRATIDGLNNALHAYSDLIFSIKLGCEIPMKYNNLKQRSEDELDYRFACAKKLYKQLLNMEETNNDARQID